MTSSNDSPELSLYQKIGIACLVLAFTIVLGLFIYYWWQLKTIRRTNEIASYISGANPGLSQKLINMRVKCIGSLPPLNKMKPSNPMAPPPPPPLPTPIPLQAPLTII